MTITQLETFLKITETGNFTAAANQLGYAQSTVTTQIRQLEEELGCLLFERLGKTVVQTPEGERLAAYAEKMMQLQREIRLEVPMAQEPAGMIRLGVSESLCYNRLPQILLKYRRRFPAVDIQLSFIMHDTFAAQLKKGILDIAYSLEFPDLQMEPAATILCRVISHPCEGTFTLDCGYKGIAGDPPGPERGKVVGVHCRAVLQSEEHWVFRMDEGHEAEIPPVGSVVYVIPRHVCPCALLYPTILVAEGGEIVDEWEVTARNRKIKF